MSEATGQSSSNQLSQSEDQQWASFAQLGGIIGFLPSLIIWLVFKERGPVTNVAAKEALNFQLTMLIAYVVGSILSVIVIGIFISLAAGVLSLVLSIVAFVKVRGGESYRYPLTIRMIK